MQKGLRRALYIFLILLLMYMSLPTSGTWFYLNHVRWLYVLILSFLATSILTPAAIYIANKKKIYDYPNDRKIHSKPIPRLGGLAIYLGFLFAILRNLNFSNELKGVVIGATIIVLIGTLDDVKGISARWKFLGQLLATVIIIFCGVRITVFPRGMPGEYFVELFFTILGVVGVTNAMNFMDGMDGLATGLGVVCGASFLIIAVQTGQRHLSWVTIALVGSCLGFLPYNFKPAKIFLGDAGSTFIGFTLAGIAIMGSWVVTKYNPMVATSVPILILSVCIFDMIYTTVSRIKNGSVRNFKEWLEYTGKDHLHHRLNFLGFSERETVFVICAISIILGLSAVVLRNAGTFEAILLLVQATMIYIVIVGLMFVARTHRE